MCGCECCISDKIIHSSFLSWHDRYLKKIKDQIQNAQSRRSGEKANHIYTTYKSTVMPHGRHIYAKFMPKHLIWKMQQCALIHILIMHFHIRNVYCNAVPTVLVLIFLTNKKNKKMKKQHPQLGFTFITSLDVVLLMVEFH